MKKKGQIAFLLTLVLSIWGYIGVKIVGNLSDTDEFNSSQAFNLPEFNNSNIGKEEYLLSLDYKDPFLKPKHNRQSRATPQINQNKNRTQKKVLSKPQKKSIPWPAINFKGSVENKNGDAPLYIVEINKVNYFYKLQEINKDLKLIKASSDSIQLEFMAKDKRVFKIK